MYVRLAHTLRHIKIDAFFVWPLCILSNKSSILPARFYAPLFSTSSFLGCTLLSFTRGSNVVVVAKVSKDSHNLAFKTHIFIPSIPLAGERPLLPSIVSSPLSSPLISSSLSSSPLLTSLPSFPLPLPFSLPCSRPLVGNGPQGRR